MSFNPPEPSPVLVVLSGPSGVGKDAVLARMKTLSLPLDYVTTVTTRPIRDGEADGRDYHFACQEDFKQLIAQDELLEWAEVYGNYYGVPKAPVRESLKNGRDVVVKIAMRYTSPTSREALEEFGDADRLLALTLYPQYSKATTGS